MKSDWSSLCWQCKFKVICVLLASMSGILLLAIGIIIGCMAPHAHSRYVIGLSIGGIVLLASSVVCCCFG